LLHLLGLELTLSVGVVAVTLALCLAQAPPLVAKSKAVAGFFQSHPAAQLMVEQHAVTGELPTQAEAVMGLRPAVAQVGHAGNLIWLCGDRQPPAYWASLPAPPTAAASAISFSVCREARLRW
jgi:hypothetical protein